MSLFVALFADAPARHLAAGTILFLRDTPVQTMFAVESGSIALDRTLADGTTLTLHVAGPGDLVAEASLFADSYHCDGIACFDTIIRSLDRPSVLHRLSTDPDIALALHRSAAREVQALRLRVEFLRMRRLSDRLDAWLDVYGPPPTGGWINVADAIGVTPAALYRELSKRKQQ